eukprot:jgi/Astpho2/3195/Aster-x1131
MGIGMDNYCVNRVMNGAAMGGSLYGTYDAFRLRVPGVYKIRHIGQTTVASAGMFGLFLAAGSLIHCGK